VSDFLQLPFAVTEIPVWSIAPFALLLGLIAIMPLAPERAKHWWEHYYPHVALALGAAVVAYYLSARPAGGATILHTAHEYVSFISLIGSLFVVAGGIHIRVRGEATPSGNVMFLVIGGLLANLVGTTGASMVLIRPYIRMNKIRISAYHIVFFIFVVSNIGGALTPIGDPPLFLGYLRGVPFFWLIEHVMVEWVATLGAVLGVFYVIDRRYFKKAPTPIRQEIERPDSWRFEGGVNLLLLPVIIGAVFLPERFFLRECVMIGAAVTSYFATPRSAHMANAFTFAPIKEVGFLFAGIFATMMPALGYLEQHGEQFGIRKPAQYFFATGGLSAVLDNAPTYLNFLTLARVSAMAEYPAEFAAIEEDEVKQVRTLLGLRPDLVVAVSLGAVFFGAMTYIGNGPNFMVKSIAEHAGVKVPTFFGYLLRYSIPILLPILVGVGWWLL
jgi:Na+/H+ antiporter NhaD/arsenite permease-like protein